MIASVNTSCFILPCWFILHLSSSSVFPNLHRTIIPARNQTCPIHGMPFHAIQFTFMRLHGHGLDSKFGRVRICKPSVSLLSININAIIPAAGDDPPMPSTGRSAGNGNNGIGRMRIKEACPRNSKVHPWYRMPPRRIEGTTSCVPRPCTSSKWPWIRPPIR